jgi:hypothetical protein
VVAGLIRSLLQAGIRKEIPGWRSAGEIPGTAPLYRLSEQLIATPNTEMIAQMALDEICPLVKRLVE